SWVPRPGGHPFPPLGLRTPSSLPGRGRCSPPPAPKEPEGRGWRGPAGTARGSTWTAVGRSSEGPAWEVGRRMRVYEVAKEFNVSSEALVHLLREMDIPVRSHMSQLGDEHVARLRTVMERERRQGSVAAERALEAALEAASTGPRRRRRRRSEKEEDTTASPTADAAEAMAAEAAEDAADRGAQLVTEGGDEPVEETVVVAPEETAVEDTAGKGETKEGAQGGAAPGPAAAGRP